MTPQPLAVWVVVVGALALVYEDLRGPAAYLVLGAVLTLAARLELRP